MAILMPLAIQHAIRTHGARDLPIMYAITHEQRFCMRMGFSPSKCGADLAARMNIIQPPHLGKAFLQSEVTHLPL